MVSLISNNPKYYNLLNLFTENVIKKTIEIQLKIIGLSS
ncbi:hypothetical protein SAMN05216556_11126 [Aequorivita viscosa]|nr:hypothetical protein SAMN05216556_11126 [Aequorivita viscosa]